MFLEDGSRDKSSQERGSRPTCRCGKAAMFAHSLRPAARDFYEGENRHRAGRGICRPEVRLSHLEDFAILCTFTGPAIARSHLPGIANVMLVPWPLRRPSLIQTIEQLEHSPFPMAMSPVPPLLRPMRRPISWAPIRTASSRPWGTRARSARYCTSHVSVVVCRWPTLRFADHTLLSRFGSKVALCRGSGILMKQRDDVVDPRAGAGPIQLLPVHNRWPTCSPVILHRDGSPLACHRLRRCGHQSSGP